jgi:hypothetical protein
MALPNVFEQEIAQQIISRLDQLTSQTAPKWGKMNVAQMLAHCNVTYEYIYENKYQKPNFLMRWILKSFVKPIVVNEVPYKQNGPTGKDFLVSDAKNFETEKMRLVAFIQKTQTLGSSHFEGLESHSFGKLNATEWNNMMYKHLDHHLRQFGV